jgi:diguanylate cyclase (GGDEF)-like protein
MRASPASTSRPVHLALRGSIVLLFAAAAVGAPAAFCAWTVIRVKAEQARAVAEACLATALSAQLEDKAHLSQQYADWVGQLRDKTGRLAWAAVLRKDGEGLEFHRRIALPLDRIRKQIRFDATETTMTPVLIAGQPSGHLQLLTIPQPEADAVLAAVVDTAPGAVLPASLPFWTVGLACAGLAGAFGCLHVALLRPIRRSARTLAQATAGTAELALLGPAPAELSELARSVRQTREELEEWKARAETLEQTVERRVESRLRDADRKARVARSEAETDALSGLATRRTLDRELPELVESHQRGPNELSIVLIDVNNFKQFNDTLGHAAGDGLLSFLGELIRRSLRKGTDLAARVGGDEFVLVLPGASQVEAAAIVKRLAALFVQHVRTQPKVERPPSISSGIACLKADHAFTASRLMELADQAMYRAKKAGQPVVAAGTL